MHWLISASDRLPENDKAFFMLVYVAAARAERCAQQTPQPSPFAAKGTASSSALGGPPSVEPFWRPSAPTRSATTTIAVGVRIKIHFAAAFYRLGAPSPFISACEWQKQAGAD